MRRITPSILSVVRVVAGTSSRERSRVPVALVTGASSGIGLELARLLAADGHRVVLAARSTTRLDEVAAELPDATVVTADLATSDGVAALLEAVSAVDVLVEQRRRRRLRPVRRGRSRPHRWR